MKQITNNLLMIRPVAFNRNEQTIVNNYYQQAHRGESALVIHEKALKEFDNLVMALQKIGVNVTVIEDTVEPNTPDALFPNNWISFHATGEVCLYPMFAENRRAERRQAILTQLQQAGFQIKQIIDYSNYEAEAQYLEGTGSMVLDRANAVAYCTLSARSNESLLQQFCNDFNYSPVVFSAKQTVRGKREFIYHTNVMMSVAEQFAMICLESIDDKTERELVISWLEKTGKDIISLSQEQLTQFAGNVLQVQGGGEQSYLIMSDKARQSLTDSQKKSIEMYVPMVSVNLDTIEFYGGGGVRCMLAEIFLSKKNVKNVRV